MKLDIVEFLSQAPHLYTIVVFKIFKEEFDDTLHLKVTGCRDEGAFFIYHIQQETKSKLFIVQFVSENYHVNYTCKKFESFRILCSHAFKVLNLNGVNHIPSDYNKEIWTKNVKKGAPLEKDIESKHETPTQALTMMKKQIDAKSI